MNINKVAIVILNYNGWQDTLVCLESIFRLEYPTYRVIVVDNNSTDNSVDMIHLWAKGSHLATPCTIDRLRALTEPPIPKPINCIDIYPDAIEVYPDDSHSDPPNLLLIHNNSNRGFSAGNNIGIKHAFIDNECNLVWLINNDTIVDPFALEHLVNSIKKHPTNGIAGSKLLYYNTPDIIQCTGIKLNQWFATVSMLENGTHNSTKVNKHPRFDYLSGASLLITRKCIENIGLLPEDYFMYMEDADFCINATRQGFTLAYADESIIYHKEGSSTGCSKEHAPMGKSYLADTLAVRNRIKFGKKYLRSHLPTIYFGVFLSFLLRLKRRQWRNAIYILHILLGLRR